jgi:hypothetical protein
MITLPVRDKFLFLPYWRRQTFHFSMAAWFQFYDEMGWDFDAIGKMDMVKASEKMIYYAAMQGNFSKGKPFRWTFEQFTTQVAGMRYGDGERLREQFITSSKIVTEKMAGSKKK